jgi:hypothetical protein
MAVYYTTTFTSMDLGNGVAWIGFTVHANTENETLGSIYHEIYVLNKQQHHCADVQDFISDAERICRENAFNPEKTKDNLRNFFEKYVFYCTKDTLVDFPYR